MVTKQPQVTWLKPEEYAGAIALFDEEFIRSRRRSISFAQRFSDVFAAQCLVAAINLDRQVVGALVVHPFLWMDGSREWRGAMIGAVCTHPRHRGMGIGAQLLAAAEQRCRELGHEFMALWAADRRLYERLGWITADRGMLGRGGGAGDSSSGTVAAGSDAIDAIHALREAQGGSRVKRLPAGYRRLLPPAERVRFYLKGRCYAVVGERGHTGYVYDLAADAAGMPRLWNQLFHSFRDLYINVERDSVAQLWLQKHASLEWSQQTLAMWKPLQNVAISFEQWYIPFLDRI